MKILIIVLCIVFVSASIFAAGQTAMVKYRTGTAMVKTDQGKWVDLKLSEKLGESSVIKTGKKSSVQLVLSDGTIYNIDAEKTITIKEISNKLKNVKNKSLFSKLSSLKAKLGKSKGSRMGSVSAVAGVRGANVADRKQINIKRAAELLWEE